jgi:hypothetical protein
MNVNFNKGVVQVVVLITCAVIVSVALQVFSPLFFEQTIKQNCPVVENTSKYNPFTGQGG